MYSGGYTGKILRINLSNKTAKEEALPEELARDFIGGAGFGIKYLFCSGAIHGSWHSFGKSDVGNWKVASHRCRRYGPVRRGIPR
jgi:hypothetical protein